MVGTVFLTFMDCKLLLLAEVLVLQLTVPGAAVPMPPKLPAYFQFGNLVFVFPYDMNEMSEFSFFYKLVFLDYLKNLYIRYLICPVYFVL